MRPETQPAPRPLVARRRSLAGGIAHRVLDVLRNGLVRDTLLRPYGLWRQRALQRGSARSQHHAYTCFFRAPRQLDALTGPALERLLQVRGPRGGMQDERPLRILNFACSNGAEAYTLAAALRRRHPRLRFHIEASDHDPALVEIAREGVYGADDVWRHGHAEHALVDELFDEEGGRYRVKPQVRAHVSFSQADLLSPALADCWGVADIVLAQNVLFHFGPDDMRRAFANLVRLLGDHSLLLIEGMDPDLKRALTCEHGLEPLDLDTRRIYQQSRQHIPSDWWNYYYGAEPWSWLRRDRARRYGSIFQRAAVA